MKRPSWRPPGTAPWSMTDDQARAATRLWAADVCSCDHTRAAHTRDYGVVRSCTTPGCTCQNYAMAQAVARR